MEVARRYVRRLMDPTLVVLAAGLGSRFGGPKQLEPIGPGGATLMDYALWDAAEAGFGKAVLVVRPDLDDDIRRRLEQRYGKRLSVTTVLQRPDDIPGTKTFSRSRPWGTAHAVLAARFAVRGPFAVINGDDYYGAAAYQAARTFLRQHGSAAPVPLWGVAGYRLADTLSKNGGVNRAVFRIDSAGELKTIEEVRSVARTDDGVLRGLRTSGARVLTGNELVSMNFWVFTPAVFDLLETAFVRFLGSRAAAKDGELLLPDVVQELIAAGQARVRVFDAGREWFGLTYPADRDDVRAALQRLVAAGAYPERLWI